MISTYNPRSRLETRSLLFQSRILYLLIVYYSHCELWGCYNEAFHCFFCICGCVKCVDCQTTHADCFPTSIVVAFFHIWSDKWGFDVLLIPALGVSHLERDALIEQYFDFRLNYVEIISFLLSTHAISISLRQL